jgi:hypothetical protein
MAECWSDVLRHLGLRIGGNNVATVRKYAERWDVSTEHFQRGVGSRRAARTRLRPLEELLREHSPYKRHSLKRRLYDEGLKERACEMYGQGEEWHGRHMSLILDHVNGVGDDNRLENLRIVCPNCAATLDTHCGRNPVAPDPRACLSCDELFVPRYPQHRYCSRACVGVAHERRYAGVPRPERRKVERPPHDRLLAEVAELGFSAVGRRYGVSDNAVRKWIRAYERLRDQ